MTETTATDTPTTSAPDWDRASEALYAALSRLAIAMATVHYRRAADDVRLPVELLRENVSDAMRALGLAGRYEVPQVGPVDGTPPGWRPWTPDLITATGTTVVVKMKCPGCGTVLGDARDEEIVTRVDGGTLPDVRDECVTCLRARIAELEAMRQPVSHPPAEPTPGEVTGEVTGEDVTAACAAMYAEDRSYNVLRSAVAAALRVDRARVAERQAAARRQPVSQLLAYLATGPDEDAELPSDIAAGLTERQRDGMDCVACGTNLDQLGLHCTQVGMVDGGQVFLCAAHERGSSR